MRPYILRLFIFLVFLNAIFSRIALAQIPAAGTHLVPDEAQRIERLAGLCRLWGAVKYFHPWLAYKDLDWDAALVAAIPKVRSARSPQEYRSAVSGMLKALHDPSTYLQPVPSVTTKVGDSKKPDKSQPYIQWIDPKTALIVANDSNQFSESAISLQFAKVFKEASRAATILFDLRNSNGFWTRDRFDGAFENLIQGDLRLASSMHRMHSGYVPQVGGTSGEYFSGQVIVQGVTLSGREHNSPHRTMAFLLNENASEFADLASGVQSAHLAKIVLEKGTQTDIGNNTYKVELPEGLAATIRISELINPNGSIGFHPDIIVPAPLNVSNVLAALKTARNAAPSPATKGGSIPTGEQRYHEKTYAAMTYPNAEYRLLALFRFWNVIHYFFPYKALMDVPWDRTLTDFIPQFETDRSALDYATTVAKLVSRINDSHGFAKNPVLDQHLGTKFPNIMLRMVEGKVVVASLPTAAKNPIEDIHVGDIVLAVDGEEVEARRARLGQLFAASTPQALTYRVLYEFLAGQENSVARIRVQRADGKTNEVEMKRVSYWPGRRPRTTPIYGVLPSGSGYMDLTRLTIAQVDMAFDKVKDTPSLIFDMRGYPNGTAWPIVTHLTPKRALGALGRRPELHSPDLEDTAYHEFKQFAETGAKSIYKGKVVILINDEAISQAEHTCLLIEVCTPTTFIGSPTMGANGDVTRTVLPGGIQVNFSGYEIRHADGRQLQRIGIQPDIKVEPTIAGIRAGRDEVLESAVNFLKSFPKQK